MQWFRALRAFSFPASVLPVIVVTALVRPVAQWDWAILAASSAAVALLHAAGNLLNDFFDYLYEVDRNLAGDEARHGRVIVRGELSRREVLVEAIICLALAVPPAVYIAARRGPATLLFGMAAVFALYAYTGPPFRLKYHALGELIIFLIFGPCLTAGASFAQTGSIELPALLLSIPIGFATTAILVGNNVRDYEEDRQAKITTIAQIAGKKAASRLYIFLVVAATLAIALLALMKIIPVVLALTPVLLALLRQPLFKILRDERQADIDAQTAKFEAILLACMLMALTLCGPSA